MLTTTGDDHTLMMMTNTPTTPEHEPPTHPHAPDDGHVERQELAREHAATRAQIVVVSIGQSAYGIPIDAVREILRVRKITWVPWTPDEVIGILNIRGEMLSVIDLRHFLRQGVSSLTEKSRIVVAQAGELAAGLLVDSLVDILDVPMTTFRPLADADADGRDSRGCLAGQCAWQGGTLTLFDSERLLHRLVVNQG
jgi:purine-binding chemotaxis protein CheW